MVGLHDVRVAQLCYQTRKLSCLTSEITKSMPTPRGNPIIADINMLMFPSIKAYHRSRLPPEVVASSYWWMLLPRLPVQCNFGDIPLCLAPAKDHVAMDTRGEY